MLDCLSPSPFPYCSDMTYLFQIYVLDFGTEMYVWHGKKVSTEKRKMAMKLAKQVWDQGYDYSELEISPLSPFKGKEPLVMF